MKLKTLKDFEFSSDNYLIKEQIKQEAIKWMKEYQLSLFGSFAEFFNITEEDIGRK